MFSPAKVRLPDDWFSYELSELASLSPLQEIDFEPLNAKGIQLVIRRDDLLHPYISGNKQYKLFGFLKDHQKFHSSKSITTFGGAYSNHVLALAAAGNALGIQTNAIIRGDKNTPLSPTLHDAQSFGMHIHFVDRTTYKLRYEKDYVKHFESIIGGDFVGGDCVGGDCVGGDCVGGDCVGDSYWVPEGGSGALGAQGAVVLGHSIAENLNSAQLNEKKVALFHACGTGSTLAGVIQGLAEAQVNNVHVFGVNVLKGFGRLKQEISEQISIETRASFPWNVLNEYHCGGYAKFPEYLASFLTYFENMTKVPLDPVYTCKVMWALVKLAESDRLEEFDTVFVVHSGGLQGRRGYGLNFPYQGEPINE